MTNKTIEYKGKIYEIGECYLFGDDDCDVSYFRKLDSLSGNEEYPFSANGVNWVYIKQLPSSENFGTITQAPVDLIDGSAYMVCFEDNDIIGLFNEDECTFNFMNLTVCLGSCTNIRKMGVIEGNN